MPIMQSVSATIQMALFLKTLILLKEYAMKASNIGDKQMKWCIYGDAKFTFGFVDCVDYKKC